MNRVKEKIVQVTEEFAKVFGRNYAPFVEEYMTEGADMVFVLQGAHAVTCRNAIKYLREAGYKVGLCRIRWFRPFPDEALAQILTKFKVAGIVDTGTSYGAPCAGGVLSTEVKAAMSEVANKPILQSFTSGLGGETITHEEFFAMAEMMRETLQAGKLVQAGTWVNFNDYHEGASQINAAKTEAAPSK